jgi:hypothetical protein
LVNAAPSRLQANVLPGSVDAKEKLALLASLNSGGLEMIEVSGAVVSMLQLKVAGVASGLPARSMARTWKL